MLLSIELLPLSPISSTEDSDHIVPVGESYVHDPVADLVETVESHLRIAVLLVQ